MGAFIVASIVGRSGGDGEEGYTLSAYAGLGRRRPALALAMTIFGVLPGLALERVGRNAVPIAVPAGTTVITEGERGDRYYAIADGTFSVSRADGIQTSLGPGEGFGEIALLRDVPRTATVVATSDARLLIVHRDEFLEALTGEAVTVAHQQAQDRLPRPEA